MLITTTTRREPSNHDCPKCRGHVWWNDTIRHVETKFPKRWWRFGMLTCADHCPEGEHVHRTDRCSDCGWLQTRIEEVEADDD